MVGHRLCRRLADLGVAGRQHVVVFGDEPQPAYDRIHLTDLFDGRDVSDLLLAQRGWYEDRNIDLRLGDPVVEIDRRARRVRSASGAESGYRRLVLATGSAPRLPRIEGADLTRVFVYRTLADLHAIQSHARTGRRAAVIGGGLLGLEAARALQHRGLRVTVIEGAASLMPAQLDQAAGIELERQIVTLGIEVLTATMTRRIEAAGACRVLHFVTGGSETVDFVVIAAGVKPRSELAAACGLARCPEGGIVVDDHLRTSDPDIFAIGDCASHRSHLYGLVAPGYEMADVLASNLSGIPARFKGAAPATRLKLLGVHVATGGRPLDRGDTFSYRRDGVYRLIRLDRGRLAGLLGVGDWPEIGRVQDAVSRRARIWPWQTDRFERTGTLWARSEERPVADWPPDAVVCNCLNVTRGQIAVACAAAQPTVASIVERTGASTLCGSCGPLIGQLAGAGTPAPLQRAWGLLAVSIAALAAAGVLLIVDPVPFATSVQSPFQLDALWRHAGYRQASGFTLLGLCILASLLSLRKRWLRGTRLGGFPAWRMAHALLGVLTLVALGAHTGARLGDNVNFALMACFGALNVLGGVAGSVTAVEAPAGRRTRYRTVLVTMHIIATWPLPALVALHVLSVYYF
jgi:nitrite reductase (NADH) large subunit